MKNNKLIIIWSSVFRDFDYYRLELSFLSKKFNIEVHEMVKIFNPNFEEVYQQRSKKKIVKRYKSLNQWHQNFKKVLKKDNVAVIYFGNIHSVKQLIVSKIISQNNVPIIMFSSGVYPVPKITKEAIKSKIKSNLNLYSFSFYLLKNFFSFLGKIYAMPDYLIASSSEDYKKFVKKYKNSKTLVYKGNYYDYSNALIYKTKSVDKKYKSNAYSVLLDSPGPRFIADEILYRFKITHTPEKWFPAINTFFSFIEKNFKTNIKIAPHPKVKAKKFSKDFNYRETVFNKLAHIVKNSKIVIVKAPGSMALAYAALFKKPILCIYSNEMEVYKGQIDKLKAFADAFKTKIININKKYTKNSIAKILKVDEKSYEKYKYKYLTSRKDKKPNYKIVTEVLNEVFQKKALK